MNPSGHPVLKILGTAGTGKSHVINIVAQWVEYYLRSSGDNIDSPYVIKCSFTGSASSQIDGQTLHKAFSLAFGDKKEEGKYRSLSDKTRDKLMNALRNLRLGNIKSNTRLYSIFCCIFSNCGRIFDD